MHKRTISNRDKDDYCIVFSFISLSTNQFYYAIAESRKYSRDVVKTVKKNFIFHVTFPENN